MKAKPANKNDIDRLESNAALISAFSYYSTWFGLQSLVAMEQGILASLSGGAAMGFCMMITLGGRFARGDRLGVMLRIIFGACSMGLGPLLEWAVKKQITRANSKLARYNHRLTLKYVQFLSRKALQPLATLGIWTGTALFLGLIYGA